MFVLIPQHVQKIEEMLFVNNEFLKLSIAFKLTLFCCFGSRGNLDSSKKFDNKLFKSKMKQVIGVNKDTHFLA